MLVITAETWPGGNEVRRHVTGEMRIANESALDAVSNYSVTTYQAVDPTSAAAGWQSRLVIHGHRRGDGAWALVRTILDRAIPKPVDAEPSSGEGKSDG